MVLELVLCNESKVKLLRFRKPWYRWKHRYVDIKDLVKDLEVNYWTDDSEDISKYCAIRDEEMLYEVIEALKKLPTNNVTVLRTFTF